MIKALFFAPQALAYGPDEPDLLAGILQAEGYAVGRERVEKALAALPAAVREAGRAVRTPEEESAYHRMLWSALLPLVGLPAPDPALVSRLGAARDDYAAWWSLHPETLPVLNELHRRGFFLGAVGRWAPSLSRFLAEFEIAGFFQWIRASAAAGVAWPDPQLLREAVAGAGCGPAEALYCAASVRDDVSCAQAAGVTPVWVNRTGIVTGHEVIAVSDLRGLLVLLGDGGEGR